MKPLPDPIAAVTTQDPGSIYAEIARLGGLVWSQSIGMWVAASADIVREVLMHPDCAVRPSGEPVPSRLIGTTVGTIFGKLTRMNDGDYHDGAKQAVSGALSTVDIERLRDEAPRHVAALIKDGNLSHFGFAFPIHVVGDMLGVPDDQLWPLTEWTGGIGRCLAPAATDYDVAAGIIAADHLWETFSILLKEGSSSRFLTTMRRAFQDAGVHDPEAVIANATGLLFQTHDATAGLLGNTIVHLSRHLEAIDASQPLDAQVRSMVAHVAHSDASIQNTRRFVTGDAMIAGQAVRAGEVILVVLASTHERADHVQGDSCPFGYGQHACPGEAIALTIAESAIAELLQRGVIPVELPSRVPYRHPANARIPVFDCPVRRPDSEESQ